jgi:uncharacterized protein (TIGR03435 family)
MLFSFPHPHFRITLVAELRVEKFMKPVVLVVVLAIAAMAASSQTPSFEAATIKPNRSDDKGIGNRFGPELFSYTNVTLRSFISNIYSLKDYELVGTPNWANTEKWDIVARTDGPADMRQKFEMAKTLLAERFQLKFHWETRELPTYTLIVLKGGPKFQQPKGDEPSGLRIADGLMVGHKEDISTFARLLSGHLNIPVVDRAGLSGVYDFELKWSPAPNEGNFTPNANGAGPPEIIDPAGPTIFTALQEQLGLKLESSKGPVQVLVVDSVQHPSEN